jgi:four helix bundle protein
MDRRSNDETAMMDFRDLDALHSAHDLVVEIHDISQSFDADDGFGVSKAIARTALSIPRAIANGCGHGETEALAQAVHTAAAQTSELEYLMLLANEIGLVDEETLAEVVGRIEDVKGRLQETLKDL